MSLFNELKRRNVFRVGIAYLAGAWLLIEVAGTLFPAFGIPDWGVRFVVIVFALGFLPVLIVSWAYEMTPEGLKREKDVVHDASITHVTAKRLDGITISLIVAALAFILADRFWLSPRHDEQLAAPTTVLTDIVQTQESESTEPQYPANSIVVLPFVNMSDDAANEYFADGISEELLNLLAKIPDLRVISRSSAFTFKDKDVPIPEIAEQLNVAHVLEGSVRKADNRVRITAQLIEAQSDTHLWSGTYNRTLDDIFAIQDEIAAMVVDALKVTLLGEAPRIKQIDPEAYALYLQAQHLSARGTNDALMQSIEMLEQVLALAPDYAPAWRALGGKYSAQVQRLLMPRDEGLAKAREALKQALAIDPDYAEAHSSLGFIALQHEGDLGAAARHIDYALSLEPTNGVVLSSASALMWALGRMDEGNTLDKYLAAKDPLSTSRLNDLAIDYIYLGQPDEAIDTVNTLLMLSPERPYSQTILARALLLKGENEAALKAIQKETGEQYRLFGLVMVYHALGRNSESDTALTKFIGKHAENRPYHIAGLIAYRGEADRAFKWLQKAAALETSEAPWNLHDPMFANIHEDPRWLPFMESIGMSPAQLAAIEFEVTLPK